MEEKEHEFSIYLSIFAEDEKGARQQAIECIRQGDYDLVLDNVEVNG